MSKNKHRVSENELAATIGIDDHPLNFGRPRTKQAQPQMSPRSNVLPIPEQEPVQEEPQLQAAPIPKIEKRIATSAAVLKAPKVTQKASFDTRIGLSLNRDQKRYIDDAAQVLQSMRTSKEFRHTNNSFLRCVINVVRERLQFAENDTANNAEEAEALIRKRLFGE